MNRKMKILIAYDGSTCADAALDDLRRAGLPPDADVVVLSVADVWLPPPAASREQFLDPAFAERVAAAREKTRAEALRAVEKAPALAVRASETVQALLRGTYALKRVPIPPPGE